MTELNLFKARQLSAAQYVLALHQPQDRVAVLVRNRVREQTMRRILSAEDIASSRFKIGPRSKMMQVPTCMLRGTWYLSTARRIVLLHSASRARKTCFAFSKASH